MASKTPAPDNRVVYLTLKHVFQGQNAVVRNTKPIKKLIQKHEEESAVADLMREYNIEVLCSSIQELLTEGVFTSTLKAKMRFPELFDPSPVQNAEREAFEAKAASDDAKSLQRAVQMSKMANGAGATQEHTAVASHEKSASPKRPEVAPAQDSDPKSTASGAEGSKIGSPLFPIYFPFRIQHELLVHLQKLLESACHGYASHTMPHVFQDRQWDCPEAVELNKWTAEFAPSKHSFTHKSNSTKSIQGILQSATNLRHVAVHRVHVTSKAIEEFFLDAEAFASLLGSDAHVAKIRKSRWRIQTSIEELERNKHLLQSKFNEKIQAIMAERTRLQQMEEAAKTELIKEDREYQEIMARSLEESIHPSAKMENLLTNGELTSREEKAQIYNSPELDDSDDEGGADTDEHDSLSWVSFEETYTF